MPGFNSGASGFFFCLRVPRISLHSGQEKKNSSSSFVSRCREKPRQRWVKYAPCVLRLPQNRFTPRPSCGNISVSISIIITPHPALSSPHRLVGVARSALRSLRKATRNDLQTEQGVFLKPFFFFFFFVEALQLLWWAASPGLSVREETMAQLLCGC